MQNISSPAVTSASLAYALSLQVLQNGLSNVTRVIEAVSRQGHAG